MKTNTDNHKTAMIAIRLLPCGEWDLLRLSGKRVQQEAQASGYMYCIRTAPYTAAKVPLSRLDFMEYLRSRGRNCFLWEHVETLRSFFKEHGYPIPQFGRLANQDRFIASKY